LQIGLPLQPSVEADARLRFALELSDGRQVRMTIGFGPDRPAPDIRIVAVKMFLQRFEQHMAPQRFAAATAEFGEGGGAIRPVRKMAFAKAGVEAFEDLELGRGDAGII